MSKLHIQSLPAEPGAIRRALFVNDKLLTSAFVDKVTLALITQHTDTTAKRVGSELNRALNDLLCLRLPHVRVFDAVEDPHTRNLLWSWGIYRIGKELTASVVFYNHETGTIGPDDSPEWLGRKFVERVHLHLKQNAHRLDPQAA